MTNHVQRKSWRLQFVAKRHAPPLFPLYPKAKRPTFQSPGSERLGRSSKRPCHVGWGKGGGRWWDEASQAWSGWENLGCSDSSLKPPNKVGEFAHFHHFGAPRVSMTLFKWGHYPNKGVMDSFFQGRGDSILSRFLFLFLFSGSRLTFADDCRWFKLSAHGLHDADRSPFTHQKL